MFEILLAALYRNSLQEYCCFLYPCTQHWDKRCEVEEDIVMSCVILCSTESVLAVEESQDSQCTEPEASLREDLPVTNQMWNIDKHKFCPVKNILSV